MKKMKNALVWSEKVGIETTNLMTELQSNYGSSVITDSEGNICVFYSNDDQNNLFLRKWFSSNDSWSNDEKINTETSNVYSSFLSVANDLEGNLYLIWSDSADYDSSGGDVDIFFKLYNATTQTWETTEVVSTESTTSSFDPSISVTISGDIHITWEDLTDYNSSGGGDWDIFYKKYVQSTESWELTEVISINSTSSSTDPVIRVDAEESFHIYWTDSTNYLGAGTDSDIFYKSKLFSYEVVVLEEISPLHSETGIVDLHWNDINGATHYNIYRAPVLLDEAFVIVDTVTVSKFTDSITIDGIYYYYVEAVTNYHTTNSVRRYVEVEIVPLQAPILAPIIYNSTTNGTVNLYWNNVADATEYFIYRSSSYIWDIGCLMPLDTSSISEYTDTLTSGGVYYYVIVASDGVEQSSISNCHYVVYEPLAPTTTEETSIGLSMIGIIAVISLASLILKKRKLKKF